MAQTLYVHAQARDTAGPCCLVLHKSLQRLREGLGRGSPSECLPSVHEVLGSIPSLWRGRGRRRRRRKALMMKTTENGEKSLYTDCFSAQHLVPGDSHPPTAYPLGKPTVVRCHECSTDRHKAENTLVATAAWGGSGGQEVIGGVLDCDKYILESEYANGCTPLEIHKYHHVVHFKRTGLSQTCPEAYLLSDSGACGVDGTHCHRCY